ncbi:MAG TPA: RnfH family protein [Noviherbaspirillum sp.]|nr:RnfH family protein [Noviherbaspirillum sp.]
MAEISVQVCYAAPSGQMLRELALPEGADLLMAIEQSGVLRDVPSIDLATCCVGIYGKLKAYNTILRDRDRIEIYRPLVADPKDSRRRRAAKKENSKVR